MHNKKCFIVAVCALSIVNAAPFCKFTINGPEYIDCSPGDSDYILSRGLVSDNDQIRRITLKGCRISEINTDSFEGLPLLEILDMSHNKLKTLTLGVFDKVPKLRNLNVSYNAITNLPAGLFNNIPNLIQLDLTGNLLENLNVALIKKASLLYLSKNLLQGKYLQANVFETSDINFLLLNENNMTGAPNTILRKLRELVYLNLDGCSLTVIPKFITAQNLDTITHLTLAGNKIREINDADIFSNLKDLEVLNLTKNSIEFMNKNLFDSLKKLKILDLSMNRLKTISEQQFQNSPSISDINLSHNLITILPVNAFRGSKLTNLNLSDNRVTYLQDNFCLELKNSGAVLAKFNFGRNPWQCACLNQLLREVKAMGVRYDGINYDGRRPVCVTANQYFCKRQPNENKLFIDMYDDIQQ